MKFAVLPTIVAALAVRVQAQDIPPTFFCSTDISGWKAAGISDLADITAAANAAITEVCAGNNPSLCGPLSSGLQLCQSTVPIGNCTGCRMFANYVFASATPPASCNNDLQFLATNCIEPGNIESSLNTANGTLTYNLNADVF